MKYDMMARLYRNVFKSGFERELRNTLNISDTASVEDTTPTEWQVGVADPAMLNDGASFLLNNRSPPNIRRRSCY